MRAAASTPSSRLAGLPRTNTAGRSSMWWLRNHALPSTQAFFALVMWFPSTVRSMSSQTQPQKVQVASVTTFSSVVAIVGSVSRSGELLDGDVHALTGGHAGAVGVAAHQPARLVAVGEEQHAGRLVAGLGGLAGHLAGAEF